MEFRVAMDGMRWLVADTPEQRKDYESGQLRTAEDGSPLFQVRLLAMDGTGSVPIRVGLVGDPGLAQGTFVRPVGLILNSIDRRGDTVTWWTAERLEPEEPGAPGGAAPVKPGAGKGSAGAAGKGAE
ncbi:hypothetical protein ACQP1W_38820 [Spirillospora sp. CA-255316]